MASPKSAWGIEIGSYAIKALRLEREGSEVRVSDFAVIPHKRVLATPDVDQDEMTRLTMGQFISQHSLEGEHMVVSVPGHSAFARFAKLPPVEAKKVPDIVKFEAVQQIPFPIEDVEWDYQTFHDEDSPEIEVGIFAITRERVQHMLGVYGELGVTPESLNLSPVAVYNAVAFDHANRSHSGPVLYVDIGTNATDVVVAEAGRVWIRTFPLGGTHFTEAIANAFKLSYSKAEKLKLEASTSKYAKQIMQAMRPVFSDLLQDLQRSIGYYNTLHQGNDLSTMIGLGSTFKIPGLRKFLGQQLQMDVQRLDEFRRISVTGREAATFSEATVNMATAYGLALQGVGLANIDANLVPVTALRDQLWHQKTKWFGAAAAVIVLGAASMVIRPMLDQNAISSQLEPQQANLLRNGERYKAEFQQLQQNANPGALATNMISLSDYRKVWPYLLVDVSRALRSSEPQQELLTADVDAIRAIEPRDRRLVALDALNGEYIPPANPNAPRRMLVTMDVRFTYSDGDPIRFLNSTVIDALRERAAQEPAPGDPYRIVPGSVTFDRALLTEMEVTEDGMTDITDSASQSRGGRDRGSQRDRDNRSNSGPPGGGGDQGETFGGGGGALSQGGDRRSTAPGSDTGDAETFGGGGARSPGGSARNPGRPGRGNTTPPRNDRPGGDDAGAAPELGNLNDAAPLPEEPSFYPKGTTIYMTPITFEIEILEPTDSTADNTVAVMPHRTEESSS